MKNALYIEKLEEQFACTICFEWLKEPRILKCGHSFCYSCIRRITKKILLPNVEKKTKCPLCQKIFVYSGSIRSTFPINLALQQMAAEGEEKLSKDICHIHEGNLKLWECESCLQMSCSECTLLNHKDCIGVVKVPKTAKEERQKLTNLVEKKLTAYRNEEKKLQKALKQLKIARKRLEKKILCHQRRSKHENDQEILDQTKIRIHKIKKLLKSGKKQLKISRKILRNLQVLRLRSQILKLKKTQLKPWKTEMKRIQRIAFQLF